MSGKNQDCDGGRAPAEGIPGDANRNAIRDAYPVIRVRRMAGVLERICSGFLFRYEIVAILPNEIASARTICRPILNEEDCSVAGFEAYLRGCLFVKRIALSGVTHAQFIGQLAVPRIGSARLNDTVDLRLRVGTRKHRIKVSTREMSNVYKTLDRTLGNSLERVIEWRNQMLAGTVVVGLLGLVFGVMALCGIAIAVFSVFTTQQNVGGSLCSSIVLGGLSMAMLAYAWRPSSLFLTPTRLPFDYELLSSEFCPSRRARSVSHDPYHSRPLGWFLKIVAVIWLMAVYLYFPRLIVFVATNVHEGMATQYGGFALILALIVPFVLLSTGNALAQSPVSTVLKNDSRRPLLYLRSFSVDGRTTLQPESFLAACLGVSGRYAQATSLTFDNFFKWWKVVQVIHPLRFIRLFFSTTGDTAEQSIVRYFRELGPILAIGKPGEAYAEVGAHREYVSDDEWRGVVVERLRECQAVLIQPAQSAGMAWELDTVFGLCRPEQILIILADVQLRANEYEDLRERLAPLVRGKVPRCPPYRGCPAVMWFDRDGSVHWSEVSYKPPLTWLFTGNAVDLEYTLRPFVQGIHGGDREPPRPARKNPWHQYAMAYALALLCVSGSLYGYFAWFASQLPVGAPVSSTADAVGPPRVVRGKEVAYEISVPANWTLRKSSDEFEYEYVSRGRGVLLITARPDWEDMSTFAPDFASSHIDNSRASISGKGVFELDSSGTMEIDGHKFVRVQFTARMNDGMIIQETAIAYSGGEGTVAIIGAITGKETSPGLQKELAGILQSVRFAPDSLPIDFAESWAQKWVIVRRPNVNTSSQDHNGIVVDPRVLQSIEYFVVEDKLGRLLVRDQGQDVWFNKREAVLAENAVDYFSGRITANLSELHSYFGRAAAWNLSGDTDNALADYTEAIRLDPKNSAAFYNRGLILIQARKFEAAIKDFTEAAQLNPQDADPFHQRAEAHKALSDFDGAIADYTEALRLRPADSALFNSRGSVRWIQQNDDEAIEDYTEAIRLDPTNSAAFYNRGLVLDKARKFEAALKDFTQAALLSPQDPDAFHKRAGVRKSLRDFDGAIADYTEVLRLDPKDSSVFNERGICCYLKNDYARAIEDFGECIRIEPANAVHHLNRGLAGLMKADYRKAIEDFTQSLKLDPSLHRAFRLRASAWKALGEYDKSIEDLSQLIQTDSTVPASFLDRGDVFRLKREFAKAVSDYEEAVRLDPEYAAALNAEASLLAICPDDQIRDGEKAVRLATRASELDDWQNPVFLATLAAAYAEARDFASAVKWQNKALEDKDYASQSGQEARARLQLYMDGKPYRDE